MAASITREKWIKMLTQNSVLLIENLQLSHSDLLTKCTSQGILSKEDLHFIEKNVTESEKVRAFINILQRINSSHYHPFLQLLLKHHTDLAQRMAESLGVEDIAKQPSKSHGHTEEKTGEETKEKSYQWWRKDFKSGRAPALRGRFAPLSSKKGHFPPHFGPKKWGPPSSAASESYQIETREEKFLRLEEYIAYGRRDKHISMHYATLEKDMESKHDLLDRLVHHGVISYNQMAYIKGTTPGEKDVYQQNRELIRVIRLVTPEQYLDFLEVLAERQEDLVLLLTQGQFEMTWQSGKDREDMTRGGNESLYKRKLFDACQGGDIEALKRLLPVEDINVTWDRKEDGVEFWHGDAPLHAAASYGCKGTVEVLLECGADVHKKNRHQQTALHLASQWGYADLVQTLIDHNADVHAADEKYCTPLHHAESSAVVDVLVKQDAELDARDHKGNTPLHLAAERGKTDLVNCFIECKADFQARNNAGNTPLHLAEKKDVVELLLHHGVDVHALNYTGMTPLHYACLHGRVSAARTLLSHGANIDAAVSWKSQQPIKPAASRVKRYQAQFSDQNYLTMYDGQTPLHLACYGEHYETVDLLLQHGANINATDSGKNTPLHVAAGEAEVKDKIINREKAVSLLLDSKSDIHAKNHRGWTPLHVASLRNRSDAVKLLLLFGADVRATDNLGRTPLHLVHSADDISRELWTNCLRRNYSFLVQSLEMDGLLEECLRHEVLSHEQFQFIKDSSTQYEKARSFLDMLMRIDSRHYLPLLKQNQPDLASVLEEDFRLPTSIIYILLSFNADPSARDLNGATPLHSASHHGFTSVAQILLQKGAKVNATDKWGRTPLHYACRKCQLKTAQLLLKKGAGMEVVDHEGNTPLSLAAAGKCTQLCQVLMRSGATSGISTLVLNADIGANLESVVKNIEEKSRQAPMRVWDDQGVICETREKLITRSGGKIELRDVTIWVPPNALTRPAFLSVTHRDYALIRQRKIQAAGLEDLLQPVMQMELQPHGLKFQHPVHLEMKKFQLGNDGSLLVFHNEMGIHEDASWMDITSDCKTNFRKHDVVLALSHFSAIEILGAVCATGMVLGGLTVTACALGLLNNRFAACEFSAFHEPIKACLKIIAKVQINEDNNELSPSTDFFGAGVTNCCLIDKQNLRFYPGSTGERSEFPFFLDQCMQRGQIFRVPVSADGINDLPSCIYIRRAKILGEQDICKVRRRTIRSEMTSKRPSAGASHHEEEQMVQLQASSSGLQNLQSHQIARQGQGELQQREMRMETVEASPSDGLAIRGVPVSRQQWRDCLQNNRDELVNSLQVDDLLNGCLELRIFIDRQIASIKANPTIYDRAGDFCDRLLRVDTQYYIPFLHLLYDHQPSLARDLAGQLGVL